MEHIEQKDASQAFKATRIASIALTCATAATLLLMHTEKSLVYIVFVGITVYLMTWAGTRGFWGQPRAATEQNFPAYLAFSTLGFFAWDFWAPQQIIGIGSSLIFTFELVMAVLLLCAIYRACFRMLFGKD